MLRLEIMPLIREFGEILHPNIKKIIPQTRLRFARDYRIFEQFSNFPDIGEVQPTIMVKPLPQFLNIGQVTEEEKLVFSQQNAEEVDITWVHARTLKKLFIPRDTDPLNKAVMSFVCELPDETPVLINWQP